MCSSGVLVMFLTMRFQLNDTGHRHFVIERSNLDELLAIISGDLSTREKAPTPPGADYRPDLAYDVVSLIATGSSDYLMNRR